jgi:hypothetical protein
MAVDPRKRQKKQEQREAKRKLKRHELVKAKNLGVGERFALAAKFPIIDSWVTTDLWDQGIGYVGLIRGMPAGMVGIAMFLVDRYCLGVKAAIAEIKSQFAYETQLRKIRSQFKIKQISPATARKFVEGAVAYAQSLGLAPHPDYQKARFIFGDINASESTEELEFGKDGKPLFISGPHDTSERCHRILTTLERTVGQGGFDTVVRLRRPMSGEVIMPDEVQIASLATVVGELG